MSRLDRLAERCARGLAQRSSRRAFLGRLGSALVGAAALPLLPVSRAAAQVPTGRDVPPTSTGNPADPGNPNACDYWRYCALSGFLCSCCGGTASSCPPGTTMSALKWVGTCRNPADGRHYLISYNDCCGKSACYRCLCERGDREMPVYRASRANDILWCTGEESTLFACTVAVIVGVSESES